MPLKKTTTSILYGVGTIFAIGIVLSILFATLLRFTSISESGVSWVMTVLTFIALFIGGFIAGGKGKKKGLVTGLLTGLTYSIIVFLIQYLGYDSLFTLEQSLYHLGYVLAAALGGAFGVNTATKAG